MSSHRIRVWVGAALTFAGVVTVAAPADAEPTSPPAPAKALTADEIVERANRVAYYQGADGRADVTMTIVDAKGNQRVREMTILRRDVPEPDAAAGEDAATTKPSDAHCGDQTLYVYFHRPPDVNKTTFLVHKHVDAKTDDDRWLYTPALDHVTRIAGKDKRNPFMGTHFVYEDVSGRSPDLDEHVLLKETGNYYVIKHTPAEGDPAEFSSYVTYIHKKTFIVVLTHYTNAKGEKYRTYKAQRFQTIDGYPTITQSRMTDLKTGAYTEATYRNVKYNVGLPEELFTDRYLRRRPPAKYMEPAKSSD